jgi:hypothetical protein
MALVFILYIFLTMLNMKNIFVTQPFHVGSKGAKSRSMALVIPHEVVKQYGICSSTVIIFRTNSTEKTITIQTIEEKANAINQDLMSDADANRFAASKQQQTLA